MVVNYIIPLCNVEGSDFEERLQNLVFIIEEFLVKQTCEVRLILIEQVVHYEKKVFIPEIKKRLKDSIYTKLELHSVTVSYPVFNKPWLYNIGMSFMASEYCFIAESDMFSPHKSLLADVVEWANKESLSWAFAWNQMHYLGKKEKEILIKDHTCPSDLHCYAVRKPSKGWMEGGPVFVRESFWVNALEGANELYTQLGAIDNDLWFRARKLAGTYASFPKTMFHLWHKDSPMKNAQSRRVNSALWRFVSRSENYKIVTKFLADHELGSRLKPLEISEEKKKEFML